MERGLRIGEGQTFSAHRTQAVNTPDMQLGKLQLGNAKRGLGKGSHAGQPSSSFLHDSAVGLPAALRAFPVCRGTAEHQSGISPTPYSVGGSGEGCWVRSCPFADSNLASTQQEVLHARAG